MAQNILPTESFNQDLSPIDTAFIPIVPVHKLDADQYMADDIDGFTDTVFGSGNMNFLAMQAAQTNESMNNVSAQETLNDANVTPSNYVSPGYVSYTPNSASGFAEPINAAALDLGTHQDSLLSSGALLNNNFQGFRENNSSELFSSFEKDTVSPPINGINGTSGFDGDSGNSGVSGISGQNGVDGRDGGPGPGTIVNEYNTFIDTTDIDIVKNFYKTITDIFGDPNNPDHDVGLNVDLGLPLLNPDAVNVDLNQVLNPVEDIVGDVDLKISPSLDLFGDSETSNAAGDTDINGLVSGELFGQHLAGVDLQVALDAVENLTGDIDLDLTVADNLLGHLAPGLIDNFDGGSGGSLGQVGDAVGDLASPITDPIVGNTFLDLSPSINLLDGSGSNNDPGDTDLQLNTGISTVDHLTSGLDLSFAENLVGDIDLTSNNNLDPLSSGDQILEATNTITAPLDTVDIPLDSITTPLDSVTAPLDGVVPAQLDSVTAPLDDFISSAVDMLQTSQPDVLDFYDASTTSNDALADIPWPDAGMIQGNDFIDNVTQIVQDALPDPVSDISSGLANLADHDTHNSVLGNVSGLFG